MSVTELVSKLLKFRDVKLPHFENIEFIVVALLVSNLETSNDAIKPQFSNELVKSLTLLVSKIVRFSIAVSLVKSLNACFRLVAYIFA